MMQPSLFDYPTTAGWREDTTSKDAALAIESSGRASNLRGRVKAFFDGGGEGTADEVAALLKERPGTIRPRVSELNKQGFIVQTGVRRASSEGRSSHVWRAA